MLWPRVCGCWSLRCPLASGFELGGQKSPLWVEGGTQVLSGCGPGRRERLARPWCAGEDCVWPSRSRCCVRSPLRGKLLPGGAARPGAQPEPGPPRGALLCCPGAPAAAFPGACASASARPQFSCQAVLHHVLRCRESPSCTDTVELFGKRELVECPRRTHRPPGRWSVPQRASCVAAGRVPGCPVCAGPLLCPPVAAGP